VFMAEAAVRTATGWRLLPRTECTGNTFKKLVITHCGGTAFRVNDTGCTNNTLCAPQFLDNTQGGLSQVAPNLVTVLSPDNCAQPALPAAATPAIHQLTKGASVQTANKPL